MDKYVLGVQSFVKIIKSTFEKGGAKIPFTWVLSIVLVFCSTFSKSGKSGKNNLLYYYNGIPIINPCIGSWQLW